MKEQLHKALIYASSAILKKKEINKVIIFRHNDLDGACSGHIASEADPDIRKDLSNVEIYSVDYGVNFNNYNFNGVDKVIIVDFSMSENHINQLYENVKDKDIIIHWIDHHESSIRLYNRIPDVIDKFIIPFLYTETGYSGALLTYIFYANYVLLYNFLIKDKHNHRPIYDYIPLLNIIVPDIVTNVSDYDTFSPNMSKDFYYGIQSFNYDIETKDGKEFWNKYLPINKNYGTTLANPTLNYTIPTPTPKYTINDILKKGRAIREYEEERDKFYRDNQLIRFKLYTDKDIYNCIAINRCSNSFVFGDEFDKVDGAFVYWLNSRGEWRYSIFRSPKMEENTTLDCREIAEHFGGGGHAGAAGFTLNRNIFDKVYSSGEMNI